MASAHLNASDVSEIVRRELRGEISAKHQPAYLTEATRLTVHGGERGRAKVIAAELGCSEKRVYQLADPLDPAVLKASEIPGMVSATRCYVLLDELEARVGRFASRLPDVQVDNETQIVTRTARAVGEFGEALSRVSGSIADGRVSPDECRQIGREIDDVYRALAELKAVVTAKAAVKTTNKNGPNAL